MKIIPCERNPDFERLIEQYADTLKAEAHTLGSRGLDESEFYTSGLFRGAIERIRGQFSATMSEKREFVRLVLNHLEDQDYVREWEPAGDANRHDHLVHLASGRVVAIETKGCMDGNNTTIFERPPQAQEFIIWSLCTNPTADPQHNAWSGIHTRLGAEIVSRQQRVDGVVIWDWLCGTAARPCPKQAGKPGRFTQIGQFEVPPPCIYVFPATTPHVRNNPNPTAQVLADVHILAALHECFGGRDEEVNYVDFDVQHADADTVRRTRIRRAGTLARESKFIALRRT